ncbi:uncharacterized protein [Tenebrio molitor]|uniref:uncharacterized protein n=1 Tax=Tenebrio molitor TaxID=7067 RepID=UPI0036246BCD
MRISLLALFFFFTLAAASPTGPGGLYSILHKANENNVQVSGALSVLRVVILLAVQLVIQPILLWILRRTIFLPFTIGKRIITLPFRIIRFIASIPRRIVMLPITLILLPVTLILLLIKAIKKIASPFVRVLKFLVHTVAFLLGVPVRAYNTLYMY